VEATEELGIFLKRDDFYLGNQRKTAKNPFKAISQAKNGFFSSLKAVYIITVDLFSGLLQ
jgi:hypothetical protein